MNLSGETADETNFEPLSFTIKVNGNNLDAKYAVQRIHTEKEINKISKAQIAISGGDPYMSTFDESEDSDFTPGNEIEILLGYKQNNTTVFKGIIEKIRISLQDGFITKPWKSLLVIEGIDKAVKLLNSFTTEIYEDKLDSEIISTLTKNVSGLTTTVQASSVTHPFLPKYGINDWEFILERATMNSYVVVNSDNSLDIKKPSSPESSKATIKNGEGTISFDAQINSGNQLADLTVNAWDIYKDTTNTNKAEEPTLKENDTLKASKITDDTSATDINFNFSQVIEQSEVKELSNAYLQEIRLKRLVGKAKFKGINDLKVGQSIKLEGFGKNFDGDIYITTLIHHVENGEYITEIGFGITPNLFELHSQSTDTGFKKMSGLHIGTVKKIDEDPLNQNRIQVQIPSFKNSGDGIWARLTHFYTSSEAGSFFFPEVDSQVVISFIGEDPRFPVVIGGLYTSANKPYKTVDDQNSYKAILSKTKLTLEFDDANKKITIKTPENNSIVLDESSKKITITDQNENKIETDPDGITITSIKDLKLSASGAITLDADKGVIVNGKGGDGIKLNGNNVAIEAQSQLTAKGTSGIDITASGAVKVEGSAVNIN